MELTELQKADLLADLNEKMNITLFDFELDKLLGIIKEHAPKCFSKAIRREEEENLDNPRFLGKKGYDEQEDQGRLTKQLFSVLHFLSDGQWHTQFEIAAESKVNITSIRSRLSDLRMKRWGEHEVLSERIKDGNGLWRYKLIPNKSSLTWKAYLKERATL